MINHGRALELEPVRVVVELKQGDFARLNKVSRDVRIPPADLLRAVALRVVSRG